MSGTQRRPGSVWLHLGAAAVGITLTAATPLQAQNNSLLGAGRRNGNTARGWATSRPAHPNDGTGAFDLAVEARATLKADRPDPKPNATLLQWSPLAVKSPDPQKIKVNDLVTIIVRESKTAKTDSKLESKKDWKLDSALDKWIRLSSEHGLVPAKFEAGNPAAAFGFANDYKGDGKYDRKDELVTRVTARVIDVKPNGNLALEATKEITMDEDGFTITLTGECRAADVTPDNTVLSTQIAEPVIDVQHKGAVRDATRRGWFQRALDTLRLF
jgi:flagellar L-ring protein precursor FlgH